ncbi:MAG: hypothetical protein ACYS7Y_32135, partial [Planctomycetota bacterium]
SSGGFSDPFSPDGRSIDAGHLTRIRQIIKACDKRRMVAIIGIFYQRTMANYNNTRRLDSSSAVVEAVKTVTHALKDYDNIIINIANEQNSAKYDQMRNGASRIYDFRDPQKIIDLCRVVRSEDPDRLVGGGGYDDDSNIVIGRSGDVDVLLFDSLGPDRDYQSGAHYDHFLANGVLGKPMVNVEMFGGWTAKFTNTNGEGGYYPPSGQFAHHKEINDAAIRPGLSVFFHSNAWCQGPSAGQPVRYDLAGDGTDESPGIRWYFEYVRTAIESDRPEIIGAGNRPDLSADSRGNVHVVYARDQMLYYRMWNAATCSWSPEENTGLVKGGNKFYSNRSDPDIVVDSRSRPHVFAWRSYAFKEGTSWTQKQPIGADSNSYRDTELAVDSKDTLYLVKRGGFNGGFIGLQKMKADAGNWTACEDPDKGYSGKNDHVYADLAISPLDDSVHVVSRHWNSDHDTGYQRSTDAGKTWTQHTSLWEADPESPHIAVDHLNIVYVTSGHGYARHFANGLWHDDGQIVTCTKRHDPELSVDKQNNAYITAFGFRFNIRRGGRWLGEQVFPPITGTKVGYVETCGADSFAYAVWEESNQAVAVDEVNDKPAPAQIVIGRILPDGDVRGLNEKSGF